MGDILTMSSILLLLPLLSLTLASPVLQPNLKTDQDRFDFIDSLLGVTTTPKPGLFDWWPNNGGWFGFGLFGKTTTTTPPPTTTNCTGLIGLGLLCDDSEDTTTVPEVATPAPEETTTPKKSGLFGLGLWPNNGGYLGFGLFGKTTTPTTTTTTTNTTTPPPTTTKCGGLLGGGLLFC